MNLVSFCFFVKWNKNFSDGVLDNHIWIKKSIHVKDNMIINLSDKIFDEKFYQNEPLNKIRLNHAFFSRYDLNLSYKIIKELDVNKSLLDNQNILVNIECSENMSSNQLIKRPVVYQALKEELLEYTGGPLHMGKKLTYYETDLEKILSSSTVPFPGDCDILLFDNDFNCKCIVEYKKRTNKDNVMIKDQSFLNYIDKDRIKYIRLNILRKYFENKSNEKIPLIVLFYATTNDSDKRKIKLESISNDLSVADSILFDIENKTVSENQKLLLHHIIDFSKRNK